MNNNNFSADSIAICKPWWDKYGIDIDKWLIDNHQ